MDECLPQEMVDFAQPFGALVFHDSRQKIGDSKHKTTFHGNFQFIIYWSRPAVSIRYKDGESHLAYFGGFYKNLWNYSIALAMACANTLVARSGSFPIQFIFDQLIVRHSMHINNHPPEELLSVLWVSTLCLVI